MPLNASLMRAQITRFADHSSTLLHERIARRAALTAPLAPDYASVDMLLATTLLAAAGAGKAHWTSACFGIDEPVNGQFEHGREPARYALIASDGSQIMPDRHKPVLFAYIQAACACIVYGAGDDPAARAAAEAIKQDRPCEMLTDDALDVSETANPAAEVSNRRDLLEIELLARDRKSVV